MTQFPMVTSFDRTATASKLDQLDNIVELRGLPNCVLSNWNWLGERSYNVENSVIWRMSCGTCEAPREFNTAIIKLKIELALHAH